MIRSDAAGSVVLMMTVNSLVVLLFWSMIYSTFIINMHSFVFMDTSGFSRLV